MSDRVRVALGDALEVLIDHRGKTPKKLGGDWSPTGVRVVSAINIKDSRIDQDNVRYVPQALYEGWMPERLRRDDVLLTSEAPLGEVARVRTDEPLCLGQRLFGLRGKQGLLDGGYLFYLLGWGEPRQQILGRATGTTVGGIRQSELVQVLLELPPISEQRAIAGVLGALDDKIESNRRMAALMSDLLRSSFTSICGQVVGECRLADLAEFTKGVSYRSADLQPSSTAMVTLKSFDRNGGYKPDGLKSYVGAYKPAQVINHGEIAVAQTDLTQGAEVVGRAIRVPCVSRYDLLVASLDLIVVRPKVGVSPEFLFGMLSTGDFREHCRSRTSGTTVLHLGSDALPSYVARLPSSEAQSTFTDLAAPLLSKMDRIGIETETLELLRDALLPELLSGRLRVRDVESDLEEAL